MKPLRLLAPVTLSLALAAAAAHAEEAASPASRAEVYFISPMNGAHVGPKFTVRFGLRGMGVAPAGIDVPGTGHHHLLINVEPMPDLTQPLPVTDNVLHFGKGQTEADIELEPGTYKLQLVLGNYLHIPHKPPIVSGTITVTVD